MLSNSEILGIVVENIKENNIKNLVVDPVMVASSGDRLLDDQAIDEDTSLVYTLSASDVDDTDLEYSATVDGNASVDVTGSTLTITPDTNYNGDIQVNVTVSAVSYTNMTLPKKA